MFCRRFGTFPFVLSVGRIEPRKNTLGLIRAARRLELPLVIAGEAPPGFERYEAECRRAAGDRTIWLGRLDHHDPLLASAYAAARVFALPSWFETPGLAALEAALGGLRGGHHAVRLDPGVLRRSRRIRAAAPARRDRPGTGETAGKMVPIPSWRSWVESRYLWPRMARMIAEVYDAVDS